MSAPEVRAQYSDLTQVAQRFGKEANQTQQLINRLQQRVQTLENGGWVGRGAQAFFGEMQDRVLPTARRLNNALDEARSVTLEIAQILKSAEDEASAPFRNGGGQANRSGDGNVSDSTSTDGSPLPPPRVYLINGINNDGSGLKEMQDYLVRNGADPATIKLTPSVYDTNLQSHVAGLQGTNLQGTNLQGTNFSSTFAQPINWLTGAGAWATNQVTGGIASATNAVTGLGATAIKSGTALANTGIGVFQTAQEYATGGASQTQRVDDFIRRDLQENPLLPGQQVIFMAHSGGGAIAANLSTKWENAVVGRSDGSTAGVDVSHVVTLGSPVFNRDAAERVADVVQIRSGGDLIGLPLLRSEEATGLVANSGTLMKEMGVGKAAGIILGFDQLARNSSDGYVLQSPSSNPLTAHGSYWQDNHGSVNVRDILRERIPGLNLTPTPVGVP